MKGKRGRQSTYSWSQGRRAFSKSTQPIFKWLGGVQKRILRYFLEHGTHPKRLRAGTIGFAFFNKEVDVTKWACYGDKRRMAKVRRDWAVDRLSRLVTRGILHTEKEGRWRYYYITPSIEQDLRTYLAADVYSLQQDGE
jgi:hypothetical protein